MSTRARILWTGMTALAVGLATATLVLSGPPAAWAQTAKALRVAVPPSLLLRADQVIE